MEAARWLTGDPPLRVVDLGAGTGKLTRTVAALGHDVVAVEPLAEMLERLRASVPGVETLTGSAERIPLADESVDAVLVAQAFHWFDQEAALAEIARVLRTRGAVGLLWNARDDDEPWVARLSELIGSEAEWDHEPPEPLAASTQFGDVERRVFRHVQRFDRSTLIDLIASRSFAATMDPPEREKLLAAVGRIYDESAEAAGGAELELPYRTYAFRATRL